MKKVFNFELRKDWYWSKNNGPALCTDKLSYLFDLSDEPSHIEVIISDKEIPQSYKCYSSGEDVTVILSDGSQEEFVTSYHVDNVLKTLPSNFYVSVY